MNYGELHIKIPELLAERGISGDRLCEDLNISPAAFSRYCRGDFRLLDARFLCKLCAYLHVAVNDLLEYIPPAGERR